MAQLRKLPSRASTTYWLPRAAARAKPFQCCPCRVWRCLRRGSGLPAGSGAPASTKRCARHAPSSAPLHTKRSPVPLLRSFVVRRASQTTPTHRRRVPVPAGFVPWRAGRAFGRVPSSSSRIKNATLRLSSAFLEADFAIDYLRPHPGVAGRLLAHWGAKVSRFSGR